MALIVEDGTGLPNAESYISIADAITYLTSRGDATFAAAILAAQEAALRNATDFMVAQYRFGWGGYRFNTVQNLDWPRIYVPITDAAAMGFGQGYPLYYPFNAVPLPVAQVCADLALRALTAPLSPDVPRVKKSVQIGPLKVDYDSNYSVTPTFVAVLNKLAPYLTGQGMQTRLIRT
jgi:hypothetical protein